MRHRQPQAPACSHPGSVWKRQTRVPGFPGWSADHGSSLPLQGNGNCSLSAFTSPLAPHGCHKAGRSTRQLQFCTGEPPWKPQLRNTHRWTRVGSGGRRAVRRTGAGTRAGKDVESSALGLPTVPKQRASLMQDDQGQRPTAAHALLHAAGNAGAPASCCIERPEATVMGTDAPATAGAKDPSPDPSPGACLALAPQREG